MIEYTHPHGHSHLFLFISFVLFFFFTNIVLFMTDTVDGADANCAASMENDYFVQSFMTFGCAMWPPAINVAILFRSFIGFHILQQNARAHNTFARPKISSRLVRI